MVHNAQPFVLRTHHPGDMARSTRRHGALYATQHGRDASFETLVGQSCTDFERDFDPVRGAWPRPRFAPGG